MIIVAYEINISVITYILYQKLLNVNNSDKLKIYTVQKNKFLNNIFNISNLDWKIIEINENKLNKLIEINYIKTSKIIDEIFADLNLQDYLKDQIKDPRFEIYLKKTIYSNNLPGLNINIKKILIILDALKYKFKSKKINFVINDFEFINFFKKKYLSDKIRIVGLLNLNLLIHNLKGFLLISISKTVLKYINILKKKNDDRSYEDFNQIIIDSPFELIDENETFYDKNFIYTSYHHPISNNSQKILKKNGLTYRAINFKNNNANNFDKDFKKYFIKALHYLKNKDLQFPNKYVNRLLIKYYTEKKIWLEFFCTNKSRVYYSNYKWNSHIEPASSAIEDLGGISLLSYHSFYEFVTYSSIVSTDILLSFNDNFEYLEKEAGSIHKINLPVGYPKNITKASEKKIREIKSHFLDKNVEKIILYLDQGNTNNEKFDLGSEESCKGYKAIFDILIKHKNVGLIIKPKKPKFILSKIMEIENYQEAISTERIYIEKDYTKNNSKNLKFPPHVPAMISDLVIHDHLVAATAGIDSYLSCKRVVYFDHYQFEELSIFNSFKNKKNIIFNDWSLLTKCVDDFINDKNKDIGKWHEDDFNKIVSNNNAYHYTKEILNDISNDFLNGKNKNEILNKIISNNKKI